MFNPEKEGFELVTKDDKWAETRGLCYVRTNGSQLTVSIPHEYMRLISKDEKPRVKFAFDESGRIAVFPSESGILPAVSSRRCSYSFYKANVWCKRVGIENSYKTMQRTRLIMDVEDRDGEALILTHNGERQVR